MVLLDGKKVAAGLRQKMAREVAEIVAKGVRPPTLAVILASEDPASQIYVRNKQKACEETGIRSLLYKLSPNSQQAELTLLISRLNADCEVDGILLQLPVAPGLDAQPCLALIDPQKDVDGFNPLNVGRLALGLAGMVPCTPAGVLELLHGYGFSTAGKDAVIIGRSDIVGKPLALLLLSKHNNATVTVCHSGTKDLAAHCQRADFIFAAIGKPRFVTADMVRPASVVVDIGINRTPEGLCGDVDFAAVSRKVAAITPVPGGVGPMTIAMLLRNTIEAWHTQLGRPGSH